MIANYGYKDAEGEFYITIDTDKCAECDEKPCLTACARGVFVGEESAYGDPVVAVDDEKRKKLKYECAACKPCTGRGELACTRACPAGAVSHSW